MRNKIVDMYQSGKGYKAISKALGLANHGQSHYPQMEKTLHLPKSIMIIPKTFGQIICGLMQQKFNFLEGVCPTTSGIKPTQHFIKRTSYQQSNMVVVMV